jgi:hypothetical protein
VNNDCSALSAADLKASLRASLSYFQTVRHKVKSIIYGRPKRKTAK